MKNDKANTVKKTAKKRKMRYDKQKGEGSPRLSPASRAKLQDRKPVVYTSKTVHKGVTITSRTTKAPTYTLTRQEYSRRG